VITTSVAPPPNGRGWNNTPVTVTFSCADTGSGIATCPTPAVVTAEGANQIVSGTAVDTAGNTATASVTLNIDQTPPVVTASQAPPPDANGWNTSAVVVSFAATEALSGLAPESVTAPLTLSADGLNLSATGQATDLAGNVGSVSRAGINIDRLPPTITVALTPGPDASGLYTGPVTAYFTCADSGSGIASCAPDQLVATTGANLSVTGTATDRAAHTASVTSRPFTMQMGTPGHACHDCRDKLWPAAGHRFGDAGYDQWLGRQLE
jgi:hypothetical protein